MKTSKHSSLKALPFILFLGLVGFVQNEAIGQGNFLSEPVASTPYDSQMSRVDAFIQGQANQAGDDRPDLSQVNTWIKQLRAVRYEYTLNWKTPQELQASRSGDCKAKAVSLYFLMRAHGAKNLMLVIGRKDSSGSETHAWLIWKHQDRVFLLDPTLQSRAIEISGSDSRHYIPSFGYSTGAKFRLAAS